MTGRTWDPLHLDVAAAAAGSLALEGRWPLPTLKRLAEGLLDAADQEVAWSARFERRHARVGPDETWVRLHADTQVPLQCQRCLELVRVPVEVDCELRFVATEEEAVALDAETEYDVLALAPRTNLRDLVEDELLLALPVVPRHERCPQPLLAPQDLPADAPEAPAAEHPFAALAALKAGGKP